MCSTVRGGRLISPNTALSLILCCVVSDKLEWMKKPIPADNLPGPRKSRSNGATICQLFSPQKLILTGLAERFGDCLSVCGEPVVRHGTAPWLQTRKRYAQWRRGVCRACRRSLSGVFLISATHIIEAPCSWDFHQCYLKMYALCGGEKVCWRDFTVF